MNAKQATLLAALRTFTFAAVAVAVTERLESVDLIVQRPGWLRRWFRRRRVVRVGGATSQPSRPTLLRRGPHRARL